MIKIFNKKMWCAQRSRLSLNSANKKVLVALTFVYITIILFSGLSEAMAANPFAASKVKDLTSLSTEVKDQIQGNGVNIIANVIGVITLVMGAVTMNWRILGFAGAALAFINTFFPFVNHSLAG